MKTSVKFFIVLLTIVTLSGCSSQKRTVHYAGIELTPTPPEPIDPPDKLVYTAVQNFLKDVKAPAFSRFDFSRIDLDNDGRRDALVLFKNPYGYWCGLHGCTMLVLQAHDRSFSLVNGIQPVREPLFVSALETNGWKNLVVRVSGRWDEAKDVAMQFDGQSYPNNPSNLPEYLRYASNGETRLFHD